MYIPFENLPEESKIWIYQSNRKFTDEEFAEIEVVLKDFVENWAAHGKGLEASYQLKYNRFIIIAINQEVHQATGCSIDSSVDFIQSLEQKYSVDLLDKMNVCYREDTEIAYTPLKEFRKLAKTPKVSPDTIVFNNLVVDKAEYESHWEVPAYDSWHSRFIK